MSVCQSSIISRQSSVPHQSVIDHQLSLEVGHIIDHRYRIRRSLGEGGMSIVFLAQDLQEHSEVAIKILKPGVTSSYVEDVVRFRREIEAVSKLRHPNIVVVKAAGQHDKMPYVVMEVLEGLSLFDLLKEKKRLEPDEAVDVVGQLAETLSYVHSRRVIHRDLKPGNIILVPREHGYEAKLLDFGLAFLMELSEISQEEEIVGTFGYMSPEATGIVKRRIDERSDLYSLGAIFYHVLTGGIPFKAREMGALLHQHVAVEPEPPRAIRPEISPVLQEIVLKLLCKDPELRYQSAPGLLYDLRRYQNGEREFIIGERDQKTKLSYQTKLVGREKELQEIKWLFQEARSGRGGICLIGGEAGVGKTRLVEEMRTHAYEQNALFIEGRCFSQDNKTPYQPFRDAMNGYIRSVQKLSEPERAGEIKRIKGVLGELGEVVIRLNSNMEEILGEAAEMVPLDPERENQRFLMVASRFFENVTEEGRAAVLFLDDLQWADEGTLALLQEIASEIGEANLLVLGTYRDREIDDKHSLAWAKQNAVGKEHRLKNMVLKPFDQAGSRRLVAGILGEKEEQAERLGAYILEKSGGNPFFAVTILRELVEQKLIVWDEGRWVEDWEKIRHMPIAASMVETVLQRIEEMPPEYLDLLSVSAVMGREFGTGLLFEVLETETEEIVRQIDELIEMQFLQEGTVKGRLLFTHDKIRDAFLLKLAPAHKRDLHVKIACAMERLHKEDREAVLFDLLHHYTEAGDKDRTLEYTFPAAARASERYANEEAIAYYTTGLAILEDKGQKGSALWLEAKEGLIALCLLTGRNDRAIEIAGEVLPLKQTPLEKARIYRQIGTAHFKKGELQDSESNIARSLGLLGERIPRSRPAVAFSIITELLVHMLHCLFPGLFFHQGEKPQNPEHIELFQAYRTLNFMYIMSDLNKFTRSLLRMLNLAEAKIGKSKELAACLTGYGSLCMAIPLFARALKYHTRALSMSSELGDEWGTAQCLHFLGHCYSWKGEYEKSKDVFDQAKEKFESIGDLWELGFVLQGLSNACRFRGDYPCAHEYLAQYLDISRKLDDSMGLTVSELLLCTLFTQQGEFAQAEEWGTRGLQLSREKQIWYVYMLNLVAIGFLDVRRGQCAEAIRFLEEAKALFEKHTFLRWEAVRVYANLADACIADYVRKSADRQQNSHNKHDLRRIRKACNLALRKTRPWIGNYSEALIIKAKYCALVGRKKRAERYFQKGIEQAKNLGYKYFIGRGYFEYGRFLKNYAREQEARECLQQAYAVFKELGCREHIKECAVLLGYAVDQGSTEEAGPQERLQLERRMTAVLNTSRYLSSILDLDELLEKIMDKTIELVGAERGILFLFPEEPQGTQGVRPKAKGEGESQPAHPQSPIVNHQSSIPIQSEIRNPKSEILPEPRVVRNVGDQDPAGFGVNQSILSRVVEERTPLILEDASVQFAIRDNESVSAATSKSVLCAPLMTKGNLLGIIYLDNHLVSGLFNEEDLKILEMISSQSAVSVENARLYKKAIAKERMEQDLNIAGQIQRLFLPKKIEEIKDVSIDAYYSPAEFIGGDYYDIVKLDDHRYGIIIVDITGHGSSAAIVMSVISFIFHSIVQRIKDSAEMMRELNNELVERLEMKKFATGIFLIYDTEREVFEYTNAGHSSILLYKKETDKIVEHDKGGVQLGIMKDLPYEKDEFAFEEGDIVLLETDGVDETRDEKGRLFSTERVKNLLLHYKHEEAAELNRIIIDEVGKFRGVLSQQDDITIITIKKCMKIGVLE